MSIHLDLNKARNTFKELTQKDWIANTVKENTIEFFLQNFKILQVFSKLN